MVTEAEIAVFEAWFGEPFDRFVRRTTCESRRDGRPTMPVPKWRPAPDKHNEYVSPYALL
jgi:hypothetical protein